MSKPLGMVLLRLMLALLLAPLALAETSLVGRTAGIVYTEPKPGARYHLMFPDAEGFLSPAALAETARDVAAALDAKGYAGPVEDLLASDMVVVVRMSVRPDRPSIDEILAGADPDSLGPEGMRYLSIDAYDLRGYAEFLRTHWDSAGEASNDSFLLWNAAVESYGRLDSYSLHLPAMLDAVQPLLGAHANIRQFVTSLSDP